MKSLTPIKRQNVKSLSVFVNNDLIVNQSIPFDTPVTKPLDDTFESPRTPVRVAFGVLISPKALKFEIISLFHLNSDSIV